MLFYIQEVPYQSNYNEHNDESKSEITNMF